MLARLTAIAFTANVVRQFTRLSKSRFVDSPEQRPSTLKASVI